MSTPRYRIVVRGEIDAAPPGPVEDMDMELAEGNTVFTGELVDQAQLQGALRALTNLGYELVSVNPVDLEIPDATDEPSEAVVRSNGI